MPSCSASSSSRTAQFVDERSEVLASGAGLNLALEGLDAFDCCLLLHKPSPQPIAQLLDPRTLLGQSLDALVMVLPGYSLAR
jgi:hypothetical protein